MTEKSITGLLKDYAAKLVTPEPGANTELELRLKGVTKEMFEQLCTTLLTHPDVINARVQNSMNVISHDVQTVRSGEKTDSQYIRTVIFDGNRADADKFVRKTNLTRPIPMAEFMKYTIGLAREQEIKRFTSNANALVRFKARISFDYAPFDKSSTQIVGAQAAQAASTSAPRGVIWRFDLTAVKRGELSTMGSDLKAIKNDLFTALSKPDTYLRYLRHDMIDIYEVEVEHVGKTPPTRDDLAAIPRVLFAMINPQYMIDAAYQDEIYFAASYIVAPAMLPLFKNPTHRLKKLGNPVIALVKTTYYSDIFPPDGYYATDKADGVRTMIIIRGNRCRILLSSTMLEFCLTDCAGSAGDTNSAGSVGDTNSVSICEAELMFAGEHTYTAANSIAGKRTGGLTDGSNDGSTNGPTDGPTDGPNDGPTDGLDDADAFADEILNELNMEPTVGAKPTVDVSQHLAKTQAAKTQAAESSGPLTPSEASPKQFLIRVFDGIALNGENITSKPMSERIMALQTYADQISLYVSPQGAHVISARYTKLTSGNLEAEFKSIQNAKYPYHTDGIIISSPDSSYSDTKHYKWKPFEQNTIDFLAIKCPQQLLGIKPFEVQPGKTLYLLFVGISHRMREKLGIGLIQEYRRIFPHQPPDYYPIQFAPSANPLAYIYYHPAALDLDHKIVELGRVREDGRTKSVTGTTEGKNAWLFHRVRDDRAMESGYFGNDYRIAESTYSNFIDPFDIEHLWSRAHSYFEKTADTTYSAANKYQRYVISTILAANLSNCKWVIDLAAGRGADLHRYQSIHVGNALFVDIDQAAIAELIRRKFSYYLDKKRYVGRGNGDHESNQSSGRSNSDVTENNYSKVVVKDVKSMTIHTLVADLKSPYQQLIASTYQYGINPGMVDGIVCNFALHYMCDTIEHLRNILSFTARMLRVGGVFMFVVMDGAAVFGMLKPIATGQQWTIQENDVTKYAITKKYAGTTLTPVGQYIAVKLPFVEEMQEEPLCNIACVIAEAAKFGFVVELNSPVSAYLDKFAHSNREVYRKLTDDDKMYVDLYRSITLRLNKAAK